MTTTTLPEPAHSLPGLCAPGRSPEIPVSADLYGWLVASWKLDVLFYVVDVSRQNLEAEAHFSWALEGGAVPDDHTAPPDKSCNMYGNTLRILDPSLDAWRVTWFSPVTGQCNELIGRSDGHDIVQIGTPLWTGEALQSDAETWKLQGQFRARRLAITSFEKGQSL